MLCVDWVLKLGRMSYELSRKVKEQHSCPLGGWIMGSVTVTGNAPVPDIPSLLKLRVLDSLHVGEARDRHSIVCRGVACLLVAWRMSVALWMQPQGAMRAISFAGPTGRVTQRQARRSVCFTISSRVEPARARGEGDRRCAASGQTCRNAMIGQLNCLTQAHDAPLSPGHIDKATIVG